MKAEQRPVVLRVVRVQVRGEDIRIAGYLYTLPENENRSYLHTARVAGTLSFACFIGALCVWVLRWGA